MTNVSYREFTGSAAENYERYFVPAIGRPVAECFLGVVGVDEGAHVLDVGCGTGVLARLVADTVPGVGSITGIDVAADMIERAGRALDSPGTPIDWHCGDAAAMPFLPASFDVVMSQLALMLVEDPVAVVREMGRVATVGGRVLVTTPGPIPPTFASMEQAITDHINPDLAGFVRAVFSMHEADELAALLGDAGLDAVEASTYTAAFDLPDPMSFLWQYINLTPMAPIVAEAPEAARVALEEQVVAAWEPYVRHGRVRVDQPMVLASGVRS